MPERSPRCRKTFRDEPPVSHSRTGRGRTREKFATEPKEKLETILSRFGRSGFLSLDVKWLGEVYGVFLKDDAPVRVATLSAIINIFRRSGEVGLIFWRSAFDPIDFRVVTDARSIALPVNYIAFHGCIIYNFEFDKVFESHGRVLVTDSSAEISDNTLRAAGIGKVYLAKEFMTRNDEDELKVLESTLSGLYSQFFIKSDDRRKIAEAVTRIFDAAREGKAYSVLVEHREIDRDSIEWPNEKFADARAGGEDIVQFLRRVWKPFIDAGATRVDLRNVDKSADRAVAAYTLVGPDGSRKSLPKDVHFPTRKELNDKILESGLIQPGDVERLAVAKRRRMRKEFDS